MWSNPQIYQPSYIPPLLLPLLVLLEISIWIASSIGGFGVTLRSICEVTAQYYHSEMERAHYSPPWANTSIIGIAGGSGSGKTSLAVEIVSSLNVPWVVILSMVNSTPSFHTSMQWNPLNLPKRTRSTESRRQSNKNWPSRTSMTSTLPTPLILICW